MFTIEDRERLAGLLVTRAYDDPRVLGAARTGSFARGAADRWSDIDLFFGIDPDHTTAEVLTDSSAWLYGEIGAVHHFDLHVDLPGGPATYRAFVFGDGMEVDLGLAPAAAFAALRGEPFDVLFGDTADDPTGLGPADSPGGVGGAPSTGPAEQAPARPEHVQHLVGLGWHHALHARTAVARSQPLLAEYWITALRNHATTLAMQRHDLPSAYAKGADRLPGPVRQALAAAMATGLDTGELTRARAAAVEVFLAEVEHVDAPAAARLRPVITNDS